MGGLAVILVGCATQEQQQAAVPTPTVAVTASPTLTAEPTVAPTPMAEPVTCDTAFTADTYAKFIADGLTFRDAGSQADVDALVGADGLRCQWTAPGTDLTVRYANWTRDDAAWQTLKTQLLADDYTETGPYSVSRSMSEFDSAYSYRDGVVSYASPSTFIGGVAALR